MKIRLTILTLEFTGALFWGYSSGCDSAIEGNHSVQIFDLGCDIAYIQQLYKLRLIDDLSVRLFNHFLARLTQMQLYREHKQHINIS